MSIPHYLPPAKQKRPRRSWGIIIPLCLLAAYNLSMSAYLIVLVHQHP